MEEDLYIPEWLREIGPELQERIDREQRERRTVHEAQLRPRSKEERFMRDWQNEADSATANLKTLDQSDAPKEDVDRQRVRLTDALIHLGRFQEADLAAPNDAERLKVRHIMEAVDRDDHYVCGCADVSRVTKGNEVAVIPGSHKKDSIFSPVHRKVTPLVVCTGCEHANVTPVVPEHHPALAKTQAEIAEFERFVNRKR